MHSSRVLAGIACREMGRSAGAIVNACLEIGNSCRARRCGCSRPSSRASWLANRCLPEFFTTIRVRMVCDWLCRWIRFPVQSACSYWLPRARMAHGIVKHSKTMSENMVIHFNTPMSLASRSREPTLRESVCTCNCQNKTSQLLAPSWIACTPDRGYEISCRSTLTSDPDTACMRPHLGRYTLDPQVAI